MRSVRHVGLYGAPEKQHFQFWMRPQVGRNPRPFRALGPQALGGEDWSDRYHPFLPLRFPPLLLKRHLGHQQLRHCRMRSAVPMRSFAADRESRPRLRQN